MHTIELELSSRSYPIIVGTGVAEKINDYIPAGAQKAAIITQPEIGIGLSTHIESRTFYIGQGETAKSLSTIEMLCSQFATWGLSRADVIIGLGGGLVTDIAGFAAATYHRGVPVVHVATTLLGQVDAAIGGKTGVNLAEGKNLVGAYWQPEAVICDVDHLKTLPKKEFLSGMGEVAKYHFLGGGQLDKLDLVERIKRCVEIKASIVSSDEREGGLRAILNYGHTLGHAVEIACGYRLRHGEAVAVGLVYAAEVAKALNRIDAERVDEHTRVVKEYGLSSSIPKDLDPELLLELMARDKKALDSLTMVLDGPNGVEPVSDLDVELLREVLLNTQAANS